VVAVSPHRACLPDGVPSFTSNQGSQGSFVGGYTSQAASGPVLTRESNCF